jgi:hypothetical protein
LVLETEKEVPERYENGDFVIVLYQGNFYPGLITKMPREEEAGPTVDCMTLAKKSWMWPDQKDILIYNWADIIKKINPPKRLSKRGHFAVPEMQDVLQF